MDSRRNIESGAILLSDSSFSRKILSKYQRGRSHFKIPAMIFRKNMEYFLSQRVNLDFLIQFHIHTSNIVSSLITRNVRSMREIFWGLKTEKHLPKLTMKLNLLKNIHSMILRTEAIRLPSEVIQRLLISVEEANLYTPVNLYRLNYSHHIQREKTREYSSEFGQKSPAILPHTNLLLNDGIPLNPAIHLRRIYSVSSSTKRKDILKKEIFYINKQLFKNTSQNWLSFSKPLVKNYHFNFVSGFNSSINTQQGNTFKASSEDFHFNNQQKMENEIQEIKKIVVETKTMTEASKSTHHTGSKDIKQHLDINRISDQVYKNIEQTIRIERERRGL